MNDTQIDMRHFAKSAGTNIMVKAGNDVFAPARACTSFSPASSRW
jgi:hypothetical protein